MLYISERLTSTSAHLISALDHGFLRPCHAAAITATCTDETATVTYDVVSWTTKELPVVKSDRARCSTVPTARVASTGSDAVVVMLSDQSRDRLASGSFAMPSQDKTVAVYALMDSSWDAPSAEDLTTVLRAFTGVFSTSWACLEAAGVPPRRPYT